MKAQISIITMLALLLPTQLVFAYPGESIVRDANGDYVVTYWNGANLMRSIFFPATKIEPKAKSRWQLSTANLITYRYAIANGGGAKQSITSVRIGNISRIFGSQTMPTISSITTPEAAIAAVQKMSKALVIPNGWEGVADVDPLNSSALQADWFFFTSNHPNNSAIGVMPGSEIHGFGYSSPDMPGIGSMQLEGEVENQGVYEDEGPDPQESAIASQLEQIEKNDFVLRNVASPSISIPVPFDAAVLLDRIRTHVATWPGRQLLDPAFAAQLDSYMVAAVDAYRLNNTKAGREHIMTVRRMLVKEHHHVDHDDEDDDDTEERKTATRLSIDRLAARVLDFDLRYVLKRAEREHEEREGKKGWD